MSRHVTPRRVCYDGGMTTRSLIPALAILAAACTPQAINAPVPVPEVASRELSRETETCGATGDCVTPLRCVARVCRAPSTSRLGEYYWIAGEVAAEKGDLARATETLALAATTYETEHLEPPAGLLCAHGAALRRHVGDPRAAEQSARLLHRCLLTSARGSTEHERALTELAGLEPLGLDPTLLARDKVADTYITRAPWKPATIRVKVERTTASPVKGYATFIDTVVETDPTRQRLGACHDLSQAPAQTPVSVLVNVKYKGRFDEDEEIFLSGGTFEFEARGVGAETPATACVKAAMVEQTAPFGEKANGPSWTGGLTITLTPEG